MSNIVIPYGYVYRIINKNNNKTYIGCRKLSKDRYWREYLGSGSLISEDIERYGLNLFIKQFICYAFSIDDLYEKEFNYIKKEKSLNKAEYNLYSGKGAGGDTFRLLTEEKLKETREKQSQGVKRFLNNGGEPWNKGESKATNKSLLEKSNKAIANKTYAGENNPMFNTKWDLQRKKDHVKK